MLEKEIQLISMTIEVESTMSLHNRKCSLLVELKVEIVLHKHASYNSIFGDLLIKCRPE